MKRLFHIAAILLFATGSAAADVIRLRDSVRRTADDQPVLLRDIALLEGPVAEGFGGLVVHLLHYREFFPNIHLLNHKTDLQIIKFRQY